MMEKALKILKEIRNIENEYDHMKKHRFDKEISELEEAMQPKTCDVCKWNAQVGNVGIFHCWKSRELHYCQANGFIDYCNEFEPFEPKETHENRHIKRW